MLSITVFEFELVHDNAGALVDEPPRDTSQFLMVTLVLPLREIPVPDEDSA